MGLEQQRAKVYSVQAVAVLAGFVEPWVQKVVHMGKTVEEVPLSVLGLSQSAVVRRSAMSCSVDRMEKVRLGRTEIGGGRRPIRNDLVVLGARTAWKSSRQAL